MNNHTILKNIVRLTVEESIIDYEVKYDITGRVYEIKPLVFDLPEIAQKLILGDTSEPKRQKIYDRENLVKMILPYGIVGETSFYKEELSSLVDAIETEIEIRGIVKKELYKLAIEDSYEYGVLEAYLSPRFNSETSMKNWVEVLEFTENVDTRRYKMNFLTFISSSPKLGFHLIVLALPLIDNGEKKSMAYEYLVNYKNPECKSFLLSELKTCKNGAAIGGIIKTLNLLRVISPDLQDNFIALYNSEIEFNSTSTMHLLRALASYPNEKTIAFGKRIAESNGRSSYHATKLLLEVGYPAEEISDFFLPKLLTAHPTDSLSAFAIFGNCEELTPFLPSSSELIDLQIKILEGNREIEIMYSLPSVIKRNFDASASSKLLSCLESTNVSLLEGVLVTISELMSDEKIENEFFFTEKALQQYEKILDNDSVATHAISLINRIWDKDKTRNFIPMLITKIDFNKNVSLNLRFLENINFYLGYLDYDERLTEIYLTAAKSSNASYREAGLKGLKYSYQVDIIDSLSYLRDDPSRNVQKAYEELSEPLSFIRSFNEEKAVFFKTIPESSLEWSNFSKLNESKQKPLIQSLSTLIIENGFAFSYYLRDLDEKGVAFKMVYYKAMCLHTLGWERIIKKELEWLHKKVKPQKQTSTQDRPSENSKTFEEKLDAVFEKNSEEDKTKDLEERKLALDAIRIISQYPRVTISLQLGYDLLDNMQDEELSIRMRSYLILKERNLLPPDYKLSFGDRMTSFLHGY